MLEPSVTCAKAYFFCFRIDLIYPDNRTSLPSRLSSSRAVESSNCAHRSRCAEVTVAVAAAVTAGDGDDAAAAEVSLGACVVKHRLSRCRCIMISLIE